MRVAVTFAATEQLNVFAGGRSVTGGNPDRLNNVEVVKLPEAAKGVWSVEIFPHAVPSPAQDFALVVTGAVRWYWAPRTASGRRSP